VRAALARVLALGLAGLLAAGCSSEAAPVEPTPTPVESDVLLLVQVQDRSGYATANALMSVAPTTSTVVSPDPAQIAYVPDSLLVPVEAASITLGATPQQPDTLTPWQSVRAGLGLAVDGSWTLDRLAFAGLIDAVGGIYVDIPQAVQIGDPDSEAVIVIPAGRQRLGGIAGADYATETWSAGDASTLQRFRDVWVAVLARLPESPERLRQILTSLGSLARTTTDVDTLQVFLESGRAAVLDRSVDEAEVDVEVIRAGARPASVLSAAGSRTVDTMFASFRLPDSAPSTTAPEEGATP
jgi:hypothetical protein